MPIDLEKQGLETRIPQHARFEYAGTDATVACMYELAGGDRGEKNLMLRLLVEDIIRHVEERDKLSQVSAIYWWFRGHYTFVPDPRKDELVKDPVRMTTEIFERGIALGDCDDASTWLLATPRTIGIDTRLYRTSFRRGTNSPLTHVLAVAVDQYGRRIVMDPVADKNTREMLGRVTRYA